MSREKCNFIAVSPNPGGALDPLQVVGREALIADCWRALRTQSLALFAPRRIGKTSVLTRMRAASPDGFVVKGRDLEGIASTAEFVQVLYEDVEALLDGWRSKAKRAQAYLDRLSIDTKFIKAELRGPGWKRLLDHLFADLEDQLSERDELLVLMWDEVTLFISDLLRRGQAEDAMALLDSLRAARQRYPHIRMLLTGSIGFDEVLRELRRDHGYRNRPINDLAKRVVPLLDLCGSEALICGLLLHAGKPLDGELIQALIESCEGHPFVIQLVADRLVTMPEPHADEVGPILSQLMTPPGDPLDLNHYIERIDKQFDQDQAPIARAILDTIAQAQSGISRARLVELLSDSDRELVLATIGQLEDEFYLRRDPDHGAALVFTLELLRRFWHEERGL